MKKSLDSFYFFPTLIVLIRGSEYTRENERAIKNKTKVFFRIPLISFSIHNVFTAEKAPVTTNIILGISILIATLSVQSKVRSLLNGKGKVDAFMLQDCQEGQRPRSSSTMLLDERDFWIQSSSSSLLHSPIDIPKPSQRTVVVIRGNETS